LRREADEAASFQSSAGHWKLYEPAHSSEIEGHPGAGPGNVAAIGGTQEPIGEEMDDRDVDIDVGSRLPLDLRVESLSKKPLVIRVAGNDWHAGRLIEAIIDIFAPKGIDANHECEILSWLDIGIDIDVVHEGLDTG
jgi:hypothetical protein